MGAEGFVTEYYPRPGGPTTMRQCWESLRRNPPLECPRGIEDIASVTRSPLYREPVRETDVDRSALDDRMAPLRTLACEGFPVREVSFLDGKETGRVGWCFYGWASD